jgi:hypothetical protein
MATKRRGGFGTPELRGTLGTLLRTTTGVVRNAFERGAREGRARLDDARANRRRQDALAELGELVLELIRRGEIDLAELPEARDLVRQLDELDNEPADEPEPPRALSRGRFDDRAKRPTQPPDDDGTVSSGVVARRAPADDGTVSSGVVARRASDDGSGAVARRASADGSSGAVARRAPTDDDAVSSGVVARRAPTDDGSVASGAVVRATKLPDPGPPKNSDAPSTRTPTRPIKDLWRPNNLPPLDDVPTLADMPAAKRSLLSHDPHRKGGISFDDDLHEYMHPDDVPPKGPPKNPGDGGA